MRKAILCILVLIVCLTLPATVLAAGDSYIGPTPQYQYENGVLRISGQGEIPYMGTGYPWDSLRAELREVVIEEGITKSRCPTLCSLSIWMRSRGALP